MLAPLARRIALARPVASAFQSRPFGASSQSNDNASSTRDVTEFKRMNGVELFADVADASARAELGKIREAEDELIANMSQEPEPIDWSAWKKEIRHPTIVDELKVVYDNTPVPDGKAEVEKMKKIVEDTFNPMLAELEKMTAEAEKEAIEYEKQAEEISYLHDNIADMSIDEFLAKYPTVQESIMKDIEDGKWFQEEAQS